MRATICLSCGDNRATDGRTCKTCDGGALLTGRQ